MSEVVAHIYEFSGAASEEGLWDLMAGLPFVRIDCRDIEGTNCYCDPESEILIEERRRRSDVAGACLAAGGAKDTRILSWIDTGDYHYMSKLTALQWAKDHGIGFSLVLFDHHPDMQEPAFGGILSCGGWVRRLLEECPLLEKAVIVGINPELRSECEGFGDRVSIIDETQCDKEDLPEIVAAVLPGTKAFLSIDKDVLGREWARTDWDHGSLSMDLLSRTIKRLAGKTEIVGADLCGGITSEKGASGDDQAVNFRTDAALMKLLREILGA